MSHINKEFLDKCLIEMKRGVCSYIEKVNFNPCVPENHNIRYEDDKSVRVKDGDDTWRLRHMNLAVESLIKERCTELQHHYSSNPELAHKDEHEHFNIIRNHLQYLVRGIKKEVKPVYDHIITLLKELELLYTT